MAVLAAEFVARDNQAVVSCADGYLTVWELTSFKMLHYTRVRHVQVGLRFCPSMGVMASWGVNDFNHEISIWEIDTLKVLHVIDGHSGPVKDICEVACNGELGKEWDPILGESALLSFSFLLRLCYCCMAEGLFKYLNLCIHLVLGRKPQRVPRNGSRAPLPSLAPRCF